MFRLPIIVGSSLVDSVLLLVVWVCFELDCLSLSLDFELEGWFGCCDCCGAANAAILVIHRVKTIPAAMTARERRVFISKPPKTCTRPEKRIRALSLG